MGLSLLRVTTVESKFDNIGLKASLNELSCTRASVNELSCTKVSVNELSCAKVSVNELTCAYAER